MEHDDSGTTRAQTDDILRHARGAKDEISALVQAVADVGRQAAGRIDIEGRMRERPVQTLAVAFGAGYVAGGGFFTPTTRTMLRLATRLWLLPALRRELTNQQEYH